MPEMKNSGIGWIGEIPYNWGIIKCKYISNFINGYSFNSGDLQTEFNYPVIRIGDIKDGGIDNINCLGVLSNTGLEKYKIIENDILLAMSGATVGKVGIANNIENSYINQRVGIIRSDFSRFLYYCLSTKEFIEYILLGANGSAQPNVSGEVFGKFVIPYPNLETQEKIISFLDKKCSEIDNLCSDIEKQISVLEDYKKSVITETVTKGLNPNLEMKDSGIEWAPNIPTHWNVMQNKYVMTKIKQICHKYNNEDIISLTMNGVIIRNLEDGGKMPTTFDGYQFVHPGNLLMCLFDYDVTPRCIGLIKDTGITSPAYSQFVMKNGNNASYYYYYYLMLDNTKEILHLAKNLRHSFTEEQLGTILTPVPPINEQIAIANYLDDKCHDIDLAITKKQAQLETLKEYKKSLIYEYVTGKKEVPENV